MWFSLTDTLEITRRQFAAIVGLPTAAVGSLFLVWVLRMADRPIEADLGSSIKFKGAAAPIIFWLLSFLAMAWAIKLVWPL